MWWPNIGEEDTTAENRARCTTENKRKASAIQEWRFHVEGRMNMQVLIPSKKYVPYCLLEYEYNMCIYIL